MNKATLYTHQCLAGSGFAVINSQVAWRLRPDLFASGQDCMLTIYQRVEVEGAKMFTAAIEGIGNVRVLARSERNLAERIGDVTGFTVTAISAYIEPEKVQPISQAIDTKAIKLAKLRALAAQELPSHDCHIHREISAARAELARLDAANQPEAVEADNQGDSHETAIDRAKELIVDMLAGGPSEAAGILVVADEEEISERTMQRAAEALGVMKSKSGFAGGWIWALPVHANQAETHREHEKTL